MHLHTYFSSYKVFVYYYFIVVVSVGFSQLSYSVDEGDGSLNLTLLLSSEVGCSCYTSVAVTTVEMSATSK